VSPPDPGVSPHGLIPDNAERSELTPLKREWAESWILGRSERGKEGQNDQVAETGPPYRFLYMFGFMDLGKNRIQDPWGKGTTVQTFANP